MYFELLGENSSIEALTLCHVVEFGDSLIFGVEFIGNTRRTIGEQ